MKNETEQRSVGLCAVCGRDLHPSMVTEYSTSEGAGQQCLCVCADCIEEFQQDRGLKLDSDELSAGAFAELVEWAKIPDVGHSVTQQPGVAPAIKSLEVRYHDGSKSEVHLAGGQAHIHLGGQSYSVASVAEYAKTLTRDMLGAPRNQTLKPAVLAPPELRVAEALIQDGIAASYEYPGYVQVNHGGAIYAFGTANDCWSGHEVTVGGEAHEPYFDSVYPSSADEAEVLGDIVEWIKSCVKEAK